MGFLNTILIINLFEIKVYLINLIKMTNSKEIDVVDVENKITTKLK